MPTWIIYLLLALVAAGVVGAPLLLSRRTNTPKAAPEPTPATGPVAAPAASAAINRTALLYGGGGAVVLLAALALFLATGKKSPSPADLAADPASAAPPSGASLPDVDTMIERLAARLQSSPNDPEGWRMLGWSYVETQRYPEAVKAYARAVALSPRNAGFQSAYGEAQVKAAGEVVTPDAAKAFQAALEADRKDERARLYTARLRQAKGDPAGALEDLFSILASAAPDSRTAPAVRKEIRRIAAASGTDVSGRLPPEPQAVPPDAGQSPNDQQAMIQGMVGRLEARLAASPRDVDGWIMLMRSRRTLGQNDMARAARDKAMAVFSDDAQARDRIKAAARDLGVS